MAYARLTPRKPYLGKSAFEVESNPWTEEFSDGTGRNWASPKMVGGCLEFEWRSHADHLLAVARAFAKGEISLRRALDDVVTEYLENRRLELFDAYADDPDECPELKTKRTFQPWELRNTATNPDLFDSECGYYNLEADTHIRHAAHCLPLPSWATRQQLDSGGPGSGYEAWYILLDEGHSLQEFHDWLVAEAAKEHSDDVLRQQPKKRPRVRSSTKRLPR